MIYAGNLNVSPDQVPDPKIDIRPEDNSIAVAVLAGGCFWCVEAVFKPLDGVTKVTSGYIGGSKETADYHAVCGGNTNHAEAVKVQFDPAIITFGQILKYFFTIAHDPTQENRQGNDVGTQYRSAIFVADDAQKKVASEYIKQLDAARIFAARIKTNLEPLTEFYPAEEYHQDYAERNPAQPYIAYTAMPKVEKLNTYFRDHLKK
jgi:peptide-methionine (S)-S-oxide reductase